MYLSLQEFIWDFPKKKSQKKEHQLSIHNQHEHCPIKPTFFPIYLCAVQQKKEKKRTELVGFIRHLCDTRSVYTQLTPSSWAATCQKSLTMTAKIALYLE